MKKLILAFVLLALTGLASAADSPHDVQALIVRGDYPGAEALLREAIKDHPQSAKAHYVLAQVLAHEGNIGEARAEATQAATLDPATHFTDPAKFQQFQKELNTALAPSSGSRSGSAQVMSEGARPAREHGGVSLLTGLLVIVGVIVLIAVLWSRRQRPAASPFGNGNQPSPFNGVPPGGGYNPNGYNGYAPPYAPPPSSGVGGAVAAGLGGLAAGVLLDEALRSHREGEVIREVGSSGNVTPDPSGQAYDDLRNDPVDFGNNDNSWDDSSSGGSDSFDDNQW